MVRRASTQFFMAVGHEQGMIRASTKVVEGTDSGGAKSELNSTPKHARMKFVRQLSKGFSLENNDFEEEVPQDRIEIMVRYIA